MYHVKRTPFGEDSLYVVPRVGTHRVSENIQNSRRVVVNRELSTVQNARTCVWVTPACYAARLASIPKVLLAWREGART